MNQETIPRAQEIVVRENGGGGERRGAVDFLPFGKAGGFAGGRGSRTVETRSPAVAQRRQTKGYETVGARRVR